MDRNELIRNVWPDKLLFASTLLMITGLLGVLHGLAFSALDVTLGSRTNLPTFVTNVSPELVLALSLATAGLAWGALRTHRFSLAATASVTGVLSVALLGLGTVLSLLAMVVLVLARREGEHQAREDGALAAELWPDKVLSASVVMTVTGVVTAGWGTGLVTETVQFQGYLPPVLFGWLSLAAGLLCLVAAGLLYHQRGFGLSLVAAVAAVFAMAVWVLGPLLALLSLLLLHQARREDEFLVPGAVDEAGG